MAFNDTLFQLGMDLTRSSTTQAEDLGSPASGSSELNGIKFAGTHLIADLSGAKRLDDVALIEKTLKECMERVGATPFQIHVYGFGTSGVSGVAVFREGHINVRTSPREGHLGCDVLFMGPEDQAELIVELLAQAFRPTTRKVTRCERSAVQAKSRTRRPRLVDRERTQAAA